MPAYYNTKSTDEKFKVSPTGTSASIDINTDEEAYGYNAYIWKAIDLGGEKSSQQKDLTITFTHYNPARNCGMSTMLDLKKSLLVPEDPTANNKPLYLYDTTTYTRDTEGTNYGDHVSNRVCQYSCCATYEPNKRYTNNSAYVNGGSPRWDTIIDSATMNFSSTPAFYLTPEYMDPILTGRIPLWFTDNKETSIGAMDIYLAPVTVKDGGSSKYQKMAKLIGYCTFNMNPSPDDKVDFCGHTGGKICTNITLNGTLAADKCTVDTVPATAANGDKLIEVVEDDSVTITTTPGTEDDVFTTKIKIPYSLLFKAGETSEQAAYTDQRRQYIILALRASHTHINSWADGYTDVDLEGTETRDQHLKEWAMNYASACRYAPFKVKVDLERNSTN